MQAFAKRHGKNSMSQDEEENANHQVNFATIDVVQTLIQSHNVANDEYKTISISPGTDLNPTLRGQASIGGANSKGATLELPAPPPTLDSRSLNRFNLSSMPWSTGCNFEFQTDWRIERICGISVNLRRSLASSPSGTKRFLKFKLDAFSWKLTAQQHLLAKGAGNMGSNFNLGQQRLTILMSLVLMCELLATNSFADEREVRTAEVTIPDSQVERLPIYGTISTNGDKLGSPV